MNLDWDWKDKIRTLVKDIHQNADSYIDSEQVSDIHRYLLLACLSERIQIETESFEHIAFPHEKRMRILQAWVDEFSMLSEIAREELESILTANDTTHFMSTRIEKCHGILLKFLKNYDKDNHVTSDMVWHSVWSGVYSTGTSFDDIMEFQRIFYDMIDLCNQRMATYQQDHPDTYDKIIYHYKDIAFLNRRMNHNAQDIAKKATSMYMHMAVTLDPTRDLESYTMSMKDIHAFIADQVDGRWYQMVALMPDKSKRFVDDMTELLFVRWSRYVTDICRRSMLDTIVQRKSRIIHELENDKHRSDCHDNRVTLSS